MALFKITPTTSVFKDVLEFQHPDAFNGDTAGADTLIVDPGAYLISVPGIGAVLAPTGAWTVMVNGSIVSQNSFGISLEAGNAAVSTIKIGLNGEVQGEAFSVGMRLLSSANINNAGTIDGAIQLGDGVFSITNSGRISAETGNTITGDSGTGNVIVHNSGTIAGRIDTASGPGNDTVTNSHLIDGGVNLGDGNNHLTNSGTIFGGFVGFNGADTVTNSHLMLEGNVLLGGGRNTLINSGTIDGDIRGGDGADTMTDFAMVGDVMKSGTITGEIFLDEGNDKFMGGANSEIVHDGDGADVVTLGGGNDTYIATGSGGADGSDIVRGGAGIDTYDASAATAACIINLTSIANGGVAPKAATGADISGTAKDAIFGFENVIGGAGNDLVFGSAVGNSLEGGDGDDTLFSLGGNDTLDGGVGNDQLVGGAGKDQLTGGTGPDLFLFGALYDSGITAGTRDLIADFEQGSDFIDLELIDANNTNAAGANDAFTFIGTNAPFTGTAGQLHAFWSAIGEIIEGDVNGDKKADFSIEIKDRTHAITLASTDFVL
jgi:Peptidase M10 serralysin C terminal/RTX calcium-binding nonapeptide repeat (4 copies)